MNTRYTVTSTAGARDGKRYGVWDWRTRAVVAWRATAKAAMNCAKRMNQKERTASSAGSVTK